MKILITIILPPKLKITMRSSYTNTTVNNEDKCHDVTVTIHLKYFTLFVITVTLYITLMETRHGLQNISALMTLSWKYVEKHLLLIRKLTIFFTIIHIAFTGLFSCHLIANVLQ